MVYCVMGCEKNMKTQIAKENFINYCEYEKGLSSNTLTEIIDYSNQKFDENDNNYTLYPLIDKFKTFQIPEKIKIGDIISFE